MTTAQVLFLSFFLSGFCSLLYQIVWLRMAFAAFGIVTPVLSVVISVFMLGLSLGSWWGGRWIERAATRTGRSAIVFYGLIEFLIGLGAFAVPRLFSLGERYLWSLGGMDSLGYLVQSGLIIAASLLPWCVLMGTTFPVAMAFVKEVDQSRATSFSFLYLANVLGAACGAASTPIVLVEILGFSSTLLVAAVFNFSICFMSLSLARRHPQPTNVTATAVTSERPTGHTAPVPFWTLTILFSTGFSSMAMEVVWTRAFTPTMKTTIYAFASLLIAYLLATWLGSCFYRRDLRRGEGYPLGKLVGFLAVTAFLPILLNDPRLRPKPMTVFLSIAPFCAVLGYLTPCLIDRYSRGWPERAGRAYALNILGCIFGPLCAGYILLPWLGVKWSLILLAAPFILLCAAPLTDRFPRRGIFAPAAVLLLMVSIAVSQTFEDGDPYREAMVRRDHTATVISFGQGMGKRLLVNGVETTTQTPITKMMSHLPLAFLRERPSSALVICFGMGTTFRSALSWEIDVYAVELVPSVRDAFGYYFSDAETVLGNSRGRIVIDDGRRFLKRFPDKFDVITLDPPPPVEAAGSSLLYSREFYENVKARLKENGIVQQWFPRGEWLILQAVARSLVYSFPYVRVYRSVEGWGFHFLASMKPIKSPSVEEIASRMPASALADLMEWYKDRDIKAVLASLLAQEVRVVDLVNPDQQIVISDDRPFNEYYLLRRRFGYGRLGVAVPAAGVLLVVAAVLLVVLRKPKGAA